MMTSQNYIRICGIFERELCRDYPIITPENFTIQYFTNRRHKSEYVVYAMIFVNNDNWKNHFKNRKEMSRELKGFGEYLSIRVELFYPIIDPNPSNNHIPPVQGRIFDGGGLSTPELLRYRFNLNGNFLSDF
jgi:hypothetical protein